MKVLTDKKNEKKETPFTMPKFLLIRAVWTKINTLYFQIFNLKKGNRLIRRKLSSMIIINTSKMESYRTCNIYTTLSRVKRF